MKSKSLMAFHVACPITCRRICFCSLGFPRTLLGAASHNALLDQVFRIQDFINDPRRDDQKISAGGISTVQVAVPRIEPLPPPPPPALLEIDADEAAVAASAQTKRVALQRKAAAAMVAAEAYARRFESGDLADAPKDPLGEEQVLSNVNVMCRLCFSGENEGSKRARGMLSCRSCGKKYHRSCLKTWAQHRDLFHWSSWTCPSCRTCEVCRRTGDPNKFMFCRRCDGAYHCYCQQPPHKNVSSGPYLCPKHTRCHSCGSNVPGNGLSVRWFLGYTCCDACGRLFVKGNYCPVCLKVYRDSESTPMVCCDVCQRWVHCQCDGISDEKYSQFQVDGNLQYKCATCRGECYQIKDLQDAVQELWRRKDVADQDLIATLRAAAGLPTQEETFSISPYSDDEDNVPTTSKSEFGCSLKFSLKGLVDKSPKKTKEYGKKSANKKPKKKGYQTPSISKKEPYQILEGPNDVHSSGQSFDGDKSGDIQSLENEEQDIFSSPDAGSPNLTRLRFVNQPEVVKHKLIDEVMVCDDDRISKPVSFKGNKPHCLDSGEDAGKFASKSQPVKANKLVINLGSRKINITRSPSADASSCLRERDLMASNGREDAHQHRKSDKLMADGHDSNTKCTDDNGDRVEYSSQLKGSNLAGRDGTFIKLGRVKTEVIDLNPKVGRGSSAGEYDTTLSDYSLSIMGKRSRGRSVDVSGPKGEPPTLRKQLEGKPDVQSKIDDDCSRTPVSNSLPKESKLSLKFKFRNHQLENGNSSVPHGEEERIFVKGQRSKRKRPSPIMERTSFEEDQNAMQSHDNLPVDARILKRLGKESIGKVVEVHHSADDSWHRGVVSDAILGTSKLSVTLDNGRVRTLELENQGVRFAPQKQKQKKSKT